MDAATGALRAAQPKILLLEDDAGVRRSLQLLLQAQGFEVRAYAASAALLADETARDAACLVADYRVEDIDGIAVLMRLRAKNWTGPAILITAFSSQDLRERATSAGYAVVLEKPLRQHVLVETISRLAAHRRASEI
ncbi:response regulator [Sphingobium sp. BYY-5]|uniref:response regulator n=1 Tax=Sphingobium sp. BYY-5 TaxID=2926400 RepID=UPI001FA7CEC7|nr:response regulator [Sphingobium sp. BYY-5]MCI4592459.1 response regulator [Sphingobium sp. BYY-5]